MKKISVSLFAVLPLLLAASGCEVSTCEGDECDFSFDDGGFGSDEDGGSGGDLDGGGGDLDGGDADGGASGDVDGGDTGAELTTIDEFCTAQLAVGQAWADAFDTCLCPNDTATARDNFLQRSLIFGGKVRCLDQLEPRVDSGTITFVASKASACATAFAGQFAAPPAQCPAAGFDLGQLRATIGHGVANLAQIPVCREAFVGTVAKDQPCTDHLECAEQRRCLTAPGGGKTCQSPIPDSGECNGFSDCDVGLICAGALGSLSCRPKDMLVPATADCSGDGQCAEGLVCEANECATPAADIICE